MNIYDEDVWPNVDVFDLWVYDKLILSKYLGYLCGPAGVDLPNPGTYIVKPITNIVGMGKGTFIHTFESTSTDWLDPGLFWMEIFHGPHFSVDVKNGQTEVVLQGTSAGPHKFTSWTYMDVDLQHPQFIVDLSHRYGTVNYEMIGGKIIEVHLRANPDWHKYKARELVPVWKGDPIPSQDFVEDEAGERIGFMLKKFQ